MNTADPEIHTCANCRADEYAIPLTEWRMAARSFWLCPKCLPHFIHRMDEVMSRLRMAPSPPPAHHHPGESHAQG